MVFGSFLNAMEELNRNFKEDYFKARHVPDVLYHYTNLAGLKGILNSKRFWATHYLHLNDPEEIKYGDKLISQMLEKRLSKINKGNIFNHIYSEILNKRFGKSSVMSAWDDEIYLVSFSEKKDNPDHWSLYGHNGEGYAIGLKPWELKYKVKGSVVLSTKKKGLAFIKVTYNLQEQEQLISNIIDRAEEIIDREYQSLTDKEHKFFPDHATIALSQILRQLPLFFKDSSFESEHEWRIAKRRWGSKVLSGINNVAKRGVKYRVRQGISIPYLELDFTFRENLEILPLEEIQLGSKHMNTDAKETLERELQALGYSNNMPYILNSNILYP